MSRPTGLLARVAGVALAAALFAGDAPAQSSGAPLPPGSVFRDCESCPAMVVVPPGAFRMGSPTRPEEQPVRDVRIARPFAMSRTEITWNDWAACVAAQRCPLPDDHKWGREDRPVIKVRWTEAVAYARFLSETTGKRYRLPSEAEWEYAARAGTTTAYWWGDEPGAGRANCRTCEAGFEKRSAPAGSFAANPFGLHDLNGNVWEWTQDCWIADYAGAPADGAARDYDGCDKRVVRGGSWYYIANLMSAHYRTSFPAKSPSYNIGIRVVRDLP